MLVINKSAKGELGTTRYPHVRLIWGWMGAIFLYARKRIYQNSKLPERRNL